ncbi:hypothetical protein CC1G_03567 [Coprinopsis cinerea okayama7|uniref:Uncharacterized protein n=1 Tax=Coprinopsis cinerea (strain Okayama-7 / 130 / ATCC MYA-4618 / FGSC 9003) TaxID=240176 RepID=A8NCK9_COPC7|nr:hypothetical protein CC1G_03567 [Coprinopsis cinerea okayama7\|eukprot:XP_001832553.2 hypothetical protein CC1G_03567 [Coprinopsis cinerea okayama7\
MPLKLAPVAQFTFPAGFCISEINLSQDGATILLNGIRKIEAQNASSAQVYTLQPDSEDPQFKLQGELKNLRLDTDPLGLCDDLFCLGIDGELVVWNVREGTACRWQGTDNMYHVRLSFALFYSSKTPLSRWTIQRTLQRCASTKYRLYNHT